MIITTALFRVILPQLIIRWVPFITAFIFGLSLAFVVGRLFGLGSTIAGIVGVSIFSLVMLLQEISEDALFSRMTKTASKEEFFIKLREKHHVKISTKANEWLLCLGHVLMGAAMATTMFLLLSKCNC